MEFQKLKKDRGLLFLGFGLSIENQFEFLQNRWMSNRFTPRSPSGDDIFIGLNGNYGQEGIRAGTIFDPNTLDDYAISTSAQWIIPTSGGYYFNPSLDAIRDVLAD